MAVLRQLDLVVLALALPIFIAADFPLLGYAVGARRLARPAVDLPRADPPRGRLG